MIKRILAALVSAVWLLSLCGCQLAVSGKGTTANTDALCGMFITFKPLESDDADIEPMFGRDTVTLGGKEDGKPIYAKEQETDLPKYVFEGVEGIPLFDVLVNAGSESGDCWTDDSDNSFLEVKQSCGGISCASLELEGTLYLYISPVLYNEDGELVYYCNPVYQNSSGEVYMLPAYAGYEVGIEDGDNGTKITGVNWGVITLSGNTTIKIGEKEEGWTSKISFSIVGINDIQKYVLKEMNAQDKLISSIELTQDNIPDAVTLDDGTAYAILEAYSTDENGKTQAERSIVDMSTDYFTVRFPGYMGFAKNYDITMNNRPV